MLLNIFQQKRFSNLVAPLTSALTMPVTMSLPCTSSVIRAHSTARASLGSSPRTMAASWFRSYNREAKNMKIIQLIEQNKSTKYLKVKKCIFTSDSV